MATSWQFIIIFDKHETGVTKVQYSGISYLIEMLIWEETQRINIDNNISSSMQYSILQCYLPILSQKKKERDKSNKPKQKNQKHKKRRLKASKQSKLPKKEKPRDIFCSKVLEDLST